MKTIRSIFYSFLLLTASMIVIVSCDDEKDTFSILGSWTLTVKDVSGCNDAANNQLENKQCTQTSCHTIVFGPDDFTEVDLDNGVTVTESGTYTINNGTLTLNYIENGVTVDTDVATFSVDASTLVVTFEQETDGCVKKETYTKN